MRRRFGIVFQDPSLEWELTAEENMELHGVLYHVPHKLRMQRTEQLLKAFELWERRKEPVKHFSGGMKRRLEIARGLLHTPKILFLDEPTLGLDPQSRNQMWTHVKRLNETEGVTVFLTTHYMDEADRVAQRIAIIDHGKIVAQGSPSELKEQTKSDSLEHAFLALTGSSIRDESAGSARPDAAVCQNVEAISDGSNLHSLASRAEALRPVPRANLGLAGAASPLSPGAGIRSRTGVSKVRERKLPPVSRPRRDRDDGSLQLDLLRDRLALGSAIRFSQGDAGGAGAPSQHRHR